MDFASWKDRKVLAGALKAIYRAKDADAAKSALEAFDTSHWDEKYPAIAQRWRRNWERHSVLRLSGGRPADHLHHQRHRGAQRKITPRRAHERSFSNR
jgi:transposase-like protein